MTSPYRPQSVELQRKAKMNDKSRISELEDELNDLENENAMLEDECDKLKSELTALRTKAQAHGEGQEAWAIYDPDGLFVITDSVEPNTPRGTPLKDGYTCRKVRVCKEVEG